MRYFLMMIAVVTLVGCGESKEEKAAADWKVIEAAICEQLGKVTWRDQDGHWTEVPTSELTKADLEKVTELGLGGTNRDKQLTEVPEGLEKLTQLYNLDLRYNQLTDVKGLEKLVQLKYVGLQNNPALTKAQIDELRKALPKCEIYSDFD